MSRIPRVTELGSVPTAGTQTGIAPNVNTDLAQISQILGRVTGLANQAAGIFKQQAAIETRKADEVKRDLRIQQRVDNNAGIDAGMKLLPSILSQLDQGLIPVDALTDAGPAIESIVDGHIQEGNTGEYTRAFRRTVTPQIATLYRRMQSKEQDRIDDSNLHNLISGFFDPDKTPTADQVKSAIQSMETLNKHDPDMIRRTATNMLASRAANSDPPRPELVDIAEEISPDTAEEINRARKEIRRSDAVDRSNRFGEFMDRNAASFNKAVRGQISPQAAVDEVVGNADGLLGDKSGDDKQVLMAQRQLKSMLRDEFEKIEEQERIEDNRVRMLEATKDGLIDLRQSRGAFNKTSTSPLIMGASGNLIKSMTDKQWHQHILSTSINRLYEGADLPEEQATSGVQAAGGTGMPTGAIGQVTSAKRVLREAGLSDADIDTMPEPALVATANKKRYSMKMQRIWASGIMNESDHVQMVELATFMNIPRMDPKEITSNPAIMRAIQKAHDLDDHNLLVRHLPGQEALVEQIRDMREVVRARLATTGEAYSKMSQWRQRKLPKEFSETTAKQLVSDKMNEMGLNPDTNAEAHAKFYYRLQLAMLTNDLMKPEDAIEMAFSGYQRTTHIVGHPDNPRPLDVGGFDEQWSNDDSRLLERYMRAQYAHAFPEDLVLVEGGAKGMSLIRAGNGFVLADRGTPLPNARPITLEQAQLLVSMKREQNPGEEFGMDALNRALNQWQNDFSYAKEVVAMRTGGTITYEEPPGFIRNPAPGGVFPERRKPKFLAGPAPKRTPKMRTVTFRPDRSMKTFLGLPRPPIPDLDAMRKKKPKREDFFKGDKLLAHDLLKDFDPVQQDMVRWFADNHVPESEGVWPFSDAQTVWGRPNIDPLSGLYEDSPGLPDEAIATITGKAAKKVQRTLRTISKASPF
jgi:hypothetical protein